MSSHILTFNVDTGYIFEQKCMSEFGVEECGGHFEQETADQWVQWKKTCNAENIHHLTFNWFNEKLNFLRCCDTNLVLYLYSYDMRHQYICEFYVKNGSAVLEEMSSLKLLMILNEHVLKSEFFSLVNQTTFFHNLALQW